MNNSRVMATGLIFITIFSIIYLKEFARTFLVSIKNLRKSYEKSSALVKTLVGILTIYFIHAAMTAYISSFFDFISYTPISSRFMSGVYAVFLISKTINRCIEEFKEKNDISASIMLKTILFSAVVMLFIPFASWMSSEIFLTINKIYIVLINGPDADGMYRLFDVIMGWILFPLSLKTFASRINDIIAPIEHSIIYKLEPMGEAKLAEGEQLINEE